MADPIANIAISTELSAATTLSVAPGSALADELRGEIQAIADRDTVATETATN